MKTLRGVNRIEQFRKIAESLRSRIVAFEGLSGIIFLGGLTRGFADKYSDVDIIVVLAERNENLRRKIQKIGLEERKQSGVDMDLEVHFWDDFRVRKWDEMAKWDFCNSEIVFDREGKLHGIFEKNLNVPERFWLRRIVICGEYVKWYCCPPENNVGTIVEAWVDRGDLISAHYCLNYALSLLIKIAFALNKEFLPPPKWELFYSYTLKWLPRDYNKLVNEALTSGNLSKRDLDRRLTAMRKLWRDILPKMKEETGLTPELVSREYVKRVLKQG